jgi:hypothetical protein
MRHRNITKFILLFIALFIPALGFGTDVFYFLPDSLSEMNFWNKGEFVGTKSEAYCPPPASFEVIPQLALVDSLDVYQIKMTLPSNEMPPFGGMAFWFPNGFGLGGITRVEYSDDDEGADPEIKAVYVYGNVFAIKFKTAEMPPAGTMVTLTVYSIKNPSMEGDYQAIGLIYDRRFRVVSGPILSEKFHIGGGGSGIASFNYELIYSEPARVGEPIIFRIFSAVDKSGNPGNGIFKVSLTGDSVSPAGDRPILNDINVVNGEGEAEQYIFLADTIRIRAVYDSLSATATIYLLPGEPHTINADIQQTQFAGNRLYGPATLTIYDQYGNLKFDYDASVDPISITVDKGELSRSILDHQNDFIHGVADLTKAGIIYEGNTGEVLLTFAIDSERGTTSPVIYNGIDFNLIEPLPDSIYPGQTVVIYGTAYNNGNTTPIERLDFTGYFESCHDECQNTTHREAIGPGESVNIGNIISSDSLVPFSTDTVKLGLLSRYLFENDTINVLRTQAIPIEILRLLQIAYVSNSLSIDTVLAPSLLNSISFEMESSEDLSGKNCRVAAYLLLDRGDGEFIRISARNVDSDFTGKTIKIILNNAGIPDLKSPGIYQEGVRSLKVLYRLYESSSILLRSDSLVDFDSVMVLFRGDIFYVNGSLSPKTAVAGMENAFGFDIKLDGRVPIDVVSGHSYLRLNDGEKVYQVVLDEVPTWLLPGNNHFKSAPVYIPAELLGKSITAQLILEGTELYSGRVDTVIFNDTISIMETSQIKIVSTELNTVNPPFVNYGQEYFIDVVVENLSEIDMTGVRVDITEEDGQTIVASSDNNILLAGEQKIIQVPIKADSISIPAKIYKSFANAPMATAAPPDDNTVAVSIQSPAEIELGFDLNSSFGGYLTFGQPFSIDVWLKNNGEAEASEGTVTLSTNGVDFGVPDPSSMTLQIDEMGRWSLTAPSVAGEVELKLNISGVPLDKNTGFPAIIKIGTLFVPLTIESSTAELIVGGEIRQSPLIIEGTARELFSLNLKNNTDNSLNVVGLKYIDVGIVDREGKVILPTALINPDLSGFYETDSTILTPAEIIQGVLRLHFDDFILAPKETRAIIFRAKFLNNINVTGFTIKIENNDISAIFVSGPRLNQAVAVRGEYDNNFKIGGNFIVTPISTEQSLMVRNNPFNPNIDKAEIAYNLETDALVTMKIYSLTGEIVYQTEFSAGAEGGRIGSNYVSWDGTNEEGKTVVNGVYVVVIRNNESGQSYKMKLAVMK